MTIQNEGRTEEIQDGKRGNVTENQCMKPVNSCHKMWQRGSSNRFVKSEFRRLCTKDRRVLFIQLCINYKARLKQ